MAIRRERELGFTYTWSCGSNHTRYMPLQMYSKGWDVKIKKKMESHLQELKTGTDYRLRGITIKPRLEQIHKRINATKWRRPNERGYARWITFEVAVTKATFDIIAVSFSVPVYVPCYPQYTGTLWPLLSERSISQASKGCNKRRELCIPSGSV